MLQHLKLTSRKLYKCKLLWPITPTFTYLPWQISHSLYVYIQSLTAASGSWLFDCRYAQFDPGQWLEHSIFIRTDWVWIPWQVGTFFSNASFLCCDFHVVRWGLVWDWTLLHIINDDFLEEEKCLGLSFLPSIICLGRYPIAFTYTFNLRQLRQGISQVWTDQVRFPRQAGTFFSYASFLY